MAQLSVAHGVTYAMNLPSEEIYTVPIKNGVDGIVYGSIPLVYQGFVIKNYYLRFENGKVVETGAEEGADKLQALIGFDEGASYLGEVALVPNDSAIRKSGTLFIIRSMTKMHPVILRLAWDLVNASAEVNQ